MSGGKPPAGKNVVGLFITRTFEFVLHLVRAGLKDGLHDGELDICRVSSDGIIRRLITTNMSFRNFI